MNRNKLKFTSLFLVILPLCVIWLTSAVLSFAAGYRPLVSSTTWQACGITNSGDAVPIKIRRMLGRDMPLFVKVSDTWFVVSIFNDVARVTVPNAPRVFPYVCIHRDINYGVDILDDKIETKWFLTYQNDFVMFSNTAVSVSVFKQ